MSDPLVTFGLICYRQERYIEQAVRGALAQTYQPLQIVICDDASPDRTFDIARQTCAGYQGPHHVVLRRNAVRLGIGNFNAVMAEAKGALVVIAHGDDISLPHRTGEVVRAWRRHRVSMVSSNALIIDQDGAQSGPWLDPAEEFSVNLEYLATLGWHRAVLGGALAWEPEVFTLFGPLNPEGSAVSSDWILPFRAAALNGITYLPEPLLQLRKHPESKAEKYLHHSRDPMVHNESNFANNLTQFVYMYRSLEEIQKSGRRSAAELQTLHRQLVGSIVAAAVEWSVVRNRLLARGRRPDWSAPD